MWVWTLVYKGIVGGFSVLIVCCADYGPAVLDHCLLEAGFADGVQIGKGFDVATGRVLAFRKQENCSVPFVICCRPLTSWVF